LREQGIKLPLGNLESWPFQHLVVLVENRGRDADLKCASEYKLESEGLIAIGGEQGGYQNIRIQNDASYQDAFLLFLREAAT
jgi:hypothetical protein